MKFITKAEFLESVNDILKDKELKAIVKEGFDRASVGAGSFARPKYFGLIPLVKSVTKAELEEGFKNTGKAFDKDKYGINVVAVELTVTGNFYFGLINSALDVRLMGINFKKKTDFDTDKGLSEQLNIMLEQAKEYVEKVYGIK